MRLAIIIGLCILLAPVAFGQYVQEDPTENDLACDTTVHWASDITVPDIWEELQAYDSPLSQADATYIFTKGTTMGIDPAFLMAVFRMESEYGTAGIAMSTHGVGNVRHTQSCAFDYKGFCGYHTWQDSIDAWYELIAGPVYMSGGLTTVEAIIPKYAPSTENDVESYISFIRDYFSYYRDDMPPRCSAGDSVGLYQAVPSFRHELDYTLDIYQTLIEESQELIEECSYEDDFKACVDRYLAGFNSGTEDYTWGYSCDEGPEQVFNYILEQYRDCLNAFSNYCVCAIDLAQPEGRGVGGEYEINITQVGDKTKFELVDDGIQVDIKEVVSSYFSLANGELNDPRNAHNMLTLFTEGTLRLNYVGSSPQSVSISGFDLVIDGTSTSYAGLGTNVLYFFRNNSVMGLVPASKYSAHEWKNLPQCVINKRNYRFCVKDEAHSFMIYDPVTGDRSFSSPDIKFALHIRDLVPPPPLEDLVLMDAPKRETGFVASWQESNETDVVLYSVYTDDGSFSDVRSASDSYSFDPRLVECDLRSLDLTSGELQPPYVYEAVDLEGDEFEVQLEMEKPCHAGDRYYMMVPAEEEGTVYAAVTATDDSGNEDPSVHALSVRVEDDLGPSEATGIDFYSQPSNPNLINVVWTIPTTNEDGSQLTDLASFTLSHMGAPFSFSAAQKIVVQRMQTSPPTPSEPTSPIQVSYIVSAPGRPVPYCVHVAPADDAGNENSELTQVVCR